MHSFICSGFFFLGSGEGGREERREGRRVGMVPSFSLHSGLVLSAYGNKATYETMLLFFLVHSTNMVGFLYGLLLQIVQKICNHVFKR